MSVDLAVRSVRVAVALCERFTELLKGPSTVTARKQSGAMFGVVGNEEGLSLRIGEVQQIYPDIWNHLDDARKAFAARGVDVSAFDKIRAEEGVAIGAAVDVKHQRHGFGNYAVDENVKSANFNRAGHARAITAYESLMKATPDIDWAGIAKAEANDPNIAAFTRSNTTRRWIMIGLLGLVIASPFIYVWRTRQKQADRAAAYREAYVPPPMKPKLSDADQAALTKEIVTTRAMFAAAHAAWPTAVANEALLALKPSANPCEYKFSAPSDAAAEAFVKYGNDDPSLASSFAAHSVNDPIRDDELARGEAVIENVAANIESATPSDRERLRKLPTHVLFVVIDRDVEPAPGTGTEYTPGQVVGRSYVFSVAQKKNVCAGVVDVKNAADVKTSPRNNEAKQMLFRDLEVKIRQAIASGLRAI